MASRRILYPLDDKRKRGVESIQRLLDAGYTPQDISDAINKIHDMKVVVNAIPNDDED